MAEETETMQDASFGQLVSFFFLFFQVLLILTIILR